MSSGPFATAEVARRREFACLAALVLLAIAVRVVYVLEMRASPLFDAPQMDAKYHVDWANAFARGEDFQPGPFFRAPLYQWFLGVCFRLFGPSLLVPRLLQTLFGGATVLLVYLIGARTFGARVAKLAGFFTAVSWVLVFYDGELLLESLTTPLNLLALWCFLRARAGGRPRDFVACGLALGLAAITRPNILLVGVAIALVELAVEHDAWRPRVRALAWTLLGAAAPILPLTFYNGLVGKDWVLISSQAGVNLWIGNNPRSDGTSAIVPGTRADWWGGYHDAIAAAEHAEGRELLPSEVSAHYTGRALAFWRDEPVAALKLSLHKLRLFWADWEIGNNEEPRFLARTYASITRVLPYSFAIVGALACLGLFGSRGKRAWPILVFAGVYALGVVAFFVCSRYRAPLVPIFLILAARGLEWSFETLRARRWLAFAPAAALAAGSLAVSLLPPAGLATDDANGHLVVGGADLAAGRRERAIEHFRAALSLQPTNWIARRQLALALRTGGDLDGAEREYLAVLGAHPDDTTALDELADLALARNRPELAADLARRLLAVAPYDARGDYTLGRASYAERDLAAARQAFQEALGKDPLAFGAAYALGLVELELGDPAASTRALEQALASPRAGDAPSFELDAWKRVITFYGERGDVENARTRLASALRRFPEAPELATLAAALR
ncbi:MAG: glycosyltransferase family 39 protein [Planctomycetes bacterium]|nr:glycosyltransferase family 39 protein [Planctomycetota bacterium]